MSRSIGPWSRVALAAAIVATPTGVIAAQTNTPAEDEDLDPVIVTGTRATERTVAQAVAPIDVISGESIEKANKANVLEQLQSNLPSFFVPNVPTPNVGSMVRAGQLRGQNPGHTLVLVNGKRRHSTAFLGAGGFSASAPVDLSLIASSAIKRVEVLRDGASALYGSDAIAGVINIITDDSAEGGTASARYGRFFAGDGATAVVQASQGFGLGEGGHLRLSAQYDDQKIVIRNSPVNPDLLFYFPINPLTGLEVVPAGTLNTNPSLPAGAIPNPKEATRDNNAWKNQGKAPFTLKALTLDLGLPISDRAEVYSFLTYADRSSDAPQNFRTPNRDEVVRAIYPDGFTPLEAIREQDWSALAGVRGDDIAGWQWDLSSVVGNDDINLHVFNSINPTYGLASQTDFYLGDNRYQAWTSNLDLRRQVTLGAIPVGLSIGAEHRREHFQQGAGDVQSYTHGGQAVLDGPRAGAVLGRSLGVSQALPGYAPDTVQDIRRNGTSVYAGAALQLTAPWALDLAVRGEDFSDFGRQGTWRASTRYDISDRFALRGTVSTGFHAPALAALSYTAVGNANTSTNYTLAVGSPEAIALGAKPLQPEKSKNFSLGVVIEPFDGWTLALDAYQIDVDNRITQIANFNTGARPLGPAAPAPALSLALTNGVINRGDGISFLVNSSDTRTKGLEVTLDKRFTLPGGSRLNASYAANFNRITLTNIAPPSGLLATYNITLLDASSAINLRNSVPRERHVLNLDWNIGKFSFGVRESFWGTLARSGTVNVPPTTGPYAGQTQFDYDIGSLWTTDLNVNYRVSDAVRVTLSGNNVFEAKPTKTPDPLLAAYQLYAYGNNGGIGPEGGFWSVKVDLRF